MNFSDFKREVAAMLNRRVEDFYVNGVDLILNSANRAKQEAQRLLDFERLHCTVDLTVSLQNGVELSTALLHGTVTPININRIKGAYVVLSDGQMRTIECRQQSSVMSQMGRRSWNTLRTPCDHDIGDNGCGVALYRQGTKVYLYPPDKGVFGGGTDSVKICLDVIAWDQDYISDSLVGVQVNSGTDLGPLPMNVLGVPGLTTFTLFQVGILDDQPAYTPGGEFATIRGVTPSIWLHYSNLRAKWLLCNRPYDFDFCWASPTGPGSLLSPNWEPRGFSAPTTQISVYSSTIRVGDLDPVFEDLFMREAQEWMLMRVLRYLQTGFIRDQSAWPVTQKAIDDSWRSMVSWNESISESSTSYNLDS